jgi:hypothetical protein
MSTTLSAHFAPRPDVIFRTVGTESILLNLEGGLYYGLDEVGTRVWTLLADLSGEEVCQRLVQEFEVTIDQARTDVAALIDQLCERGLLAEREGARSV